MKLSIVILSHNGATLTRRCLESLNGLMERHDDYRVIAVDNGSNDALKDALGEIDHGWRNSIVHDALRQNLGVAGGRNIGLKKATDSEYILILDNDTIVLSSAIERLVAYMDAHSDVGLAAPCLRSPNGEVQVSFKRFPGVREKLLNLFGRKNVLNEPPSQDVMYPFYVIGACQLIRGDVVKKIGLLDSNIFFGPEDADYCMRVRQAGYKVAYIPDIEIVHDWQRTSHRSVFSATSRRHIKGLFYFYRKWKRFW
ncbi:MAG: glycosyltransferase family 2 protein [Muribaculaceae bacterium]|nr:glycosyltransferase family 2 protein [Muribaculaceae bacterium]